VLAETSVPRRIAWKRLYADNANALTVEFGGRTAPLSEAVARLFSGAPGIDVGRGTLGTAD
jgi:hypothetical protein